MGEAAIERLFLPTMINPRFVTFHHMLLLEAIPH